MHFEATSILVLARQLLEDMPVQAARPGSRPDGAASPPCAHTSPVLRDRLHPRMGGATYRTFPPTVRLQRADRFRGTAQAEPCGRAPTDPLVRCSTKCPGQGEKNGVRAIVADSEHGRRRDDAAPASRCVGDHRFM